MKPYQEGNKEVRLVIVHEGLIPGLHVGVNVRLYQVKKKSWLCVY